MLQVKSIRKCQIFNENSMNVETLWSHSSKIFNNVARLRLDCYLCMSRDVFSTEQFRCSAAPTAEWSPAPTDMPDSPIRPCCLRLTTLQPVKVKTNRVSARMMMMYFLTLSFFPPVYSTLYFLLVPVSAVHLPAADSNPGTGAVIRLNPVPSDPPSSSASLPSSPPLQSRNCVNMRTHKYTHMPPNSCQVNHNNYNLTVIMKRWQNYTLRSPWESQDFNIWHFCTLTHVRQHLLPGCEIRSSTVSVYEWVCVCARLFL